MKCFSITRSLGFNMIKTTPDQRKKLQKLRKTEEKKYRKFQSGNHLRVG